MAKGHLCFFNQDAKMQAYPLKLKNPSLTTKGKEPRRGRGRRCRGVEGNQWFEDLRDSGREHDLEPSNSVWYPVYQ